MSDDIVCSRCTEVLVMRAARDRTAGFDWKTPAGVWWCSGVFSDPHLPAQLVRTLLPLGSAEDSAAAVLAGLVETVRVMKSNALATGAVLAAADYDAALTHLTEASTFVVTGGTEFDAYMSPVDKIAGGHS
jgi:hypothetical protein